MFSMSYTGLKVNPVICFESRTEQFFSRKIYLTTGSKAHPTEEVDAGF